MRCCGCSGYPSKRRKNRKGRAIMIPLEIRAMLLCSTHTHTHAHTDDAVAFATIAGLLLFCHSLHLSTGTISPWKEHTYLPAPYTVQVTAAAAQLNFNFPLNVPGPPPHPPFGLHRPPAAALTYIRIYLFTVQWTLSFFFFLFLFFLASFLLPSFLYQTLGGIHLFSFLSRYPGRSVIDELSCLRIPQSTLHPASQPTQRAPLTNLPYLARAANSVFYVSACIRMGPLGLPVCLCYAVLCRVLVGQSTSQLIGFLPRSFPCLFPFPRQPALYYT